MLLQTGVLTTGPSLPLAETSAAGLFVVPLPLNVAPKLVASR
jgi:hypothetical protein